VARAVLVVGVMILPTLLGAAALGAMRVRRMWESRDRGPSPLGQPIERLAADVRRLHDQRTALLRQAPGPGRGLRIRALDAAYVDALTAACLALDVVPPRAVGAGPATTEIGRVESELRRRGLDVRPHEVR
jgi:hypothetical protein